ncbi:MAG: hypothetical protein WA885_04595 [Phormidesmis sp.]
MVRQFRASDRPETYHLECPRCGHHSIVAQGESKYSCLNCNWQRDVDDSWGELPFPLIVIAVVIIILMVMR